ncbi:hypothetical protein A2814_01435 [Candidatus Nomurabacteria bacterium RIFCSPHIGHO2_01_FULL_38_19]|uniref:Toxin n=1 Tax=Candidatus Nomurabacteria bacterium RIFCSPHIGHO2_01_FULL_38_19 TaxID=1801732 RepID=A0A1F6URF4_9BACT|nr:MAG: hypothetical protein A3G89_00355 [Candidatus Doudnabacteria bacterium RIFCSPLOWO2_12_FULL_42_9]OGI59948.1 MAG: hypothetical protein A2814_01435 [Candidatus Nomurabacteria bacterium RIFCSPHIGHO2_01_FULL_38_19]
MQKVDFNDVMVAINRGNILDIVHHPQRKKYPNQRIFIIQINQYAYLVPFIEDEEKIFLKTIYPSRKATKDYIINK